MALTDQSRPPVGVIGGGIAGLVAAYELLKAGQRVVLYEKERCLGGLSSSFELDGVKLERFYHFLCRPDDAYVSLLGELGLSNRLRWSKTRMGHFHNGHLYPFGAPWDLLTFRPFGWADKLKFAYGILWSKSQSRQSWRNIENVPAPKWLIERFGVRAFEVVHRPLIELKFGEYASQLSAAWMWARIHRVGKSRTRFTQLEVSGYLDQGTDVLIAELAKRITTGGGQIRAAAEISALRVDSGKVRGVTWEGEPIDHSAVISTIPSPALLQLLHGTSNDYLDKLRCIDSIGVRCLTLVLKRSLSPYFWINVNDPGISLAGVIQYTNLNPRPDLGGRHIVYLPQYLSSQHPGYLVSKEELQRQYVGYLKRIVPAFSEDWIDSSYLFKSQYAQPICEVGFSRLTPDIASPISGLFVTDSCQLHPDDRTVSNSIELGKKAAQLLLKSGCSGA